jgi:hypothetical protein
VHLASLMHDAWLMHGIAEARCMADAWHLAWRLAWRLAWLALQAMCMPAMSTPVLNFYASPQRHPSLPLLPQAQHTTHTAWTERCRSSCSSGPTHACSLPQSKVSPNPCLLPATKQGQSHTRAGLYVRTYTHPHVHVCIHSIHTLTQTCSLKCFISLDS